MKYAIGGVLLAAWLGLWGADVGLLVYSADTGVLHTRDCRYLVGVSIVKRYEPLAGRCKALRRLGR